jgi:preprotein translocase subunit SecA
MRDGMLRDEARELWAEVRRDSAAVIAPYPERPVRKRWAWDRPLDKPLGALMAQPFWGGSARAKRVEAILALDAELRALDDVAFDGRCLNLRATLMRDGLAPGTIVEAFALIREATARALAMRHHPVQLAGGLVMLDGGLAEMATGEGKTITALLPAIAAALAGTPVHVFTVNDYLAGRDAAKLRPVYERFGLSVGLLIHGMETHRRREAYAADVLYGTNKEITFDYLRDQTALGQARGAARRRVAELFGRAREPLLLRGLHFAIVDEADSIFIDEARTPLILSAELDADADTLYQTALELAERLEEGFDYRIVGADRLVELTDKGRATVEQLAAGLPDRRWRIRRGREELAAQAISAHRLFLRDRDYIVADGKVQIVDESTGRVMADRSWESGLHQMIEAKEAVALTGVRTTLARITYQRFFRRYLKLAGMSGTVREVAGELWADYGLRVTPVPQNRPMIRVDRGHRLCENNAAKWSVVVNAVAAIRRDEPGRPILIGTRSVGASEALSAALAAAGTPHRVLNARQDSEEAEIIAAAGDPDAVTVATNMAGRGTDIELSGQARAAGGLHVILTEYHETARIDRQLFGRAGRQGDPGSAEAITAVDDELYRLFAPVATRACVASARGTWPMSGKQADLLRRVAQSAAERRHAATRRQTEMMEDRLKTQLAFAGIQ